MLILVQVKSGNCGLQERNIHMYVYTEECILKNHFIKLKFKQQVE